MEVKCRKKEFAHAMILIVFGTIAIETETSILGDQEMIV